MSDSHPTLTQTYHERAETASHPLSRYLFRLMDLKASNLCLSADVTTARELLALADKVGPSIVVLKTHYDLISGWDYNPQTGTGVKLAALARKHGFLIFEDRKFVDIGKTVQMQYTAGTARIIEWAHITNANIDAGKDMVRAMAEAAANWKARIHYEVKTSVSVGTPVADQFEDDQDQADDLSRDERDADGRKGSIVSITTVTQSFEPADSPRLAKTNEAGDELVFPGIEEPPLDRGLLLLAQMSSKGCLMTKDYTQACVEAAREHKEFVMGYVAQQSLNQTPDDNFIHMTPGCKLPPPDEEENGHVEGDGLGQQYNTPAKLINILGTDIIIVGRGIIQAGDPQKLPCTNCVSRRKQDSCHYETGAPTAREQQAAAAAIDITPTTGIANPNTVYSPDTISPTTATSSNAEDPRSGTKVAAETFGYTGAGTLGFLQKIENTPYYPASSTSSNSHPAEHNHLQDTSTSSFNTRERYKSLIRQLPARSYIDKLVAIYLRDFNWIYYALDRDVFETQLTQWFDTPFSVLSSGGPTLLPPDLRPFPALLFQVLAVALLVLSDDDDSSSEFSGLKYAGNMTYEDLAADYSESGLQVLSVLGKRNMTLTTVLAGFLRASFLKYVALVTESWHAVGSAMRDAMEIGLHRDSVDPVLSPSEASDPGNVLENQWEIERRRRTWMTLHMWDLNMAAVLGRPTTINLTMPFPSLPIDAPVPKNRKKEPVAKRLPDSPPTPLTRALWAYEILKPLITILELEKEGPCPKNFDKVDAVHKELLDLEARTPAVFRLENPDTRWDEELRGDEGDWIKLARVLLPQLSSFELMALHRPYIFTRKRSREEALRASLKMLDAQRLHFGLLGQGLYKTFSLFFGTFDAIILMAAIYILFPKENRELVSSALQHFQWAVERFEAMSAKNALAKAALGVLRAVGVRLKRSLGCAAGTVNGIDSKVDPALLKEPQQQSTAPTHVWDSERARRPDGEKTKGSDIWGNGAGANNTDGNGLEPSPVTTVAATGFSPLSQQTQPTPEMTTTIGDNCSSNNSNGFGAGGGLFTPSLFPTDSTGTTPGQQQPLDWSWNVPNDFDWASLQPIYATQDLVFHDLLSGLTDGSDLNGTTGTATTNWIGGVTGMEETAAVQQQQEEQQQGVPQMPIPGWQFEGDFGNDSVWSLLNQFGPV
ncbi:OMPdecase-domain-containing protein [Podospora australis]|uniref:Orotidine 5'-phosphate decarboxylase n=1 Tax=Podospora australis TaxID=1536484 RepID=A0AAN6WUW1_9PEZI|nr:OMPdecase-domain-containing protein [Podospora australis]